MIIILLDKKTIIEFSNKNELKTLESKELNKESKFHYEIYKKYLEFEEESCFYMNEKYVSMNNKCIT
jgi:hypothetical protein